MGKELEKRAAPEVGKVSVLSPEEVEKLVGSLRSREVKDYFEKSFAFNGQSGRRLVREGYIFDTKYPT